MRSIQEIPILHNIPVLVRAALNEPLVNDVVQDSFRLRRALPTLRFLVERGARVVVASHIGEAGTETLAPVVKTLAKMISNVSFCETSVGPSARQAVRDLSPGHIVVLENLRRNPGETANDAAFARELASLADVFVQDSFDTCHRLHTSIVRVPTLLPAYAGFVVLDEARELTKALTPQGPSLAIIGGAKFSTKEPVLAELLRRYDKVFVGGALANDFLQARGQDVGASLVSNASADKIKTLLANPRLVLPIDSHVEDTRIVDHGPKTAALLVELVRRSKTVLWNGPLGEYEKGFFETTDRVAEAIAKSGAYSIVGGGDTVAEIERLNLLSRFSFVSTGGGAMLEYLTRGTLPGIAALG